MGVAKGRRLRAGWLVVTVAFMGWFFAGGFGLGVAVIVAAAWWILDLPRGVFWGLAVLALAATPLALAIEGLPGTGVVGAQFGLSHPVAHRLVVAALLLAGFAALDELLIPSGQPRTRTPSSAGDA